MDDFLDLDAMFASVQEEQKQEAKSNHVIASVPAGSFVKVTLQPDSLLAMALNAAPQYINNNQNTNNNNNNNNNIPSTTNNNSSNNNNNNNSSTNDPTASPIPQSTSNPTSTTSTPRGGVDSNSNNNNNNHNEPLYEPNTFHGLVINHSTQTNSLHLRMYDLNKPYNVQEQNMVLLNLKEVQDIEFIALLQANRTLEVLPEDVIQYLINTAVDKRKQLRSVLNPNTTPRGQSLILYISTLAKNVVWYDNTIVISNRFAIVEPYGLTDIKGWDQQQKQAVENTNLNTDYVSKLVQNFERDHNQKLEREAQQKELVLQQQREEEAKKQREIEEEKKKAEEEQKKQEQRQEKQWKATTRGGRR